MDAALFPSTLDAVEAQLVKLEDSLSLSSASHGDDFFDHFLQSSTPHPSLRLLIGEADPAFEASTSAQSSAESLPLEAPPSPLSLPSLSPSSPRSMASPPDSPSSLCLASSTSFPSPPPKRAAKRRQSSSSSASSVSSASKKSKRSPSASTSDSDSCAASESSSSDAALDPVSAKKERRKQQNRAAAATSRHKKLRHMADMEARIAQLTREQTQLLHDVQSLTTQNAQLKQRVLEKTQPTAPVKAEAEVSTPAVKEEEGAEHASADLASEAPSSSLSAGVVASGAESEVEGVVGGGEVDVSCAPGVFYESAVEDTHRAGDVGFAAAYPPSPLSLHLLAPVDPFSFSAQTLPHFDLDQSAPTYDDLFFAPAQDGEQPSAWMDLVV